MSEERELTLGEKRVGITFNPSNNPVVEKLKRFGSDSIDLLESLRKDGVYDAKSSEGQRSISIAQTEIELATMAAVKANFVD